MIEFNSIESELDNGEIQGNFLDQRLHGRAKLLLHRMYETVGSGLSALGGSADIKAAYRFFTNDRCSPELILKAHRDHTVDRIKQYRKVIFAQDTTDIDCKHMEAVENLGVLNDTKRPGCSLHPLIAFTPEKLCLGVLHTQFIHRDPEDLGKRKTKQKRKIEDKESYRWVVAYREACKIAKETPDTQIIVVADREADIYELFVEASKKKSKAKLLVRAAHDRILAPEEKSANEVEVVDEEVIVHKLKKRLSQAPIIATCEFEMPKGRGRNARQVKQTIRAMRVNLTPSRYKAKRLPKISINAVLLKEIDPPEGEEPVSWLLLTTLPISTPEEVKEIIDLYVARWGIEMFFKVLKSGCKIEQLQFKEASRLLICIALFMIVAWRVMYAGFLCRTSGDLPCTVIFDEDEWQAVYAIVQKVSPPEDPPSLDEMMKMVATLGGHRGRKHDAVPGIKTMWRGLQAAHQLAQGWRAYKDLGRRKPKKKHIK